MILAPLLALVISLLMLPTAVDGAVLQLDEREPAVFLLLAPKGSTRPERITEIQQVASRALAPKTNLRLLSPEAAGADLALLERCGGSDRLSCWVQAIRSSTRSAAKARFLFVIALHRDSSGKSDLSSMLIDLDDAIRRGAAKVKGDQKARQEEVENQIFEGAVLGESGVVEEADREGLERYFAKLLVGPFRATLESAGAWEPYGTIVIDAPRAGAAIELDGVPIGVTAAGSTELRSVASGRRVLVVTDGGARFERSLLVRAGSTTRAETSLAPPAIEAHPARTTILIGGFGLVAAGGLLALVAAAHSGAHPLNACWGACTDPAPRFATFCDLSAAPNDPPCRGGVLAAPLGLGLAAAGAAFSVGTLLTDPPELPWIALLAGAVLGATTYGLGAALNGVNR